MRMGLIVVERNDNFSVGVTLASLAIYAATLKRKAKQSQAVVRAKNQQNLPQTENGFKSIQGGHKVFRPSKYSI